MILGSGLRDCRCASAWAILTDTITNITGGITAIADIMGTEVFITGALRTVRITLGIGDRQSVST